MKKVARAVLSVLFVTLVDAPYHLENKHIIIIITIIIISITYRLTYIQTEGQLII